MYAQKKEREWASTVTYISLEKEYREKEHRK